MAEAAVNPKGGGSTILIVLLIVLLLGGGIGIWAMLKPKSDDESEEESTEENYGRNDRSGSKTNMTPEQIAFLFGNTGGEEPTDKEPGSKDNPIYYKDPTAQELIRDYAIKMQSDEEFMDYVRAKYNIGNALVKFNHDAQNAIDKMMGYLKGVDPNNMAPTRYLTYPVYGTYETIGEDLRSELQNLLDRGYKGINLAPNPVRDNTSPWWIESIELNLLVGSTDAAVPTAAQVWNRNPHWRIGLDHYKGMNGHWVDDRYLAKVVDASGKFEIHPWDVGAKAAYPAGTTYTFVQRWVEAIDHLDKVTEWEALRQLQKKGWFFTFVNPATGMDEEGLVNPSDDINIDFTDDDEEAPDKSTKIN